MHAVDLDPTDLMTKPMYYLKNLKCDEVTLSRPIILQSFGKEPPVLFVFGSDNEWRTVSNGGFNPDIFGSPTASASLILANAFPGITIHERHPDGTIRTLVDCRPPSLKPQAESIKERFVDVELPPAEQPQPLPYTDLTDLAESGEEDNELRQFLGLNGELVQTEVAEERFPGVTIQDGEKNL